MKATIVLAQPKREGFNRAIATAAEKALAGNGAEVVLVDLYGESFDPVMPAEELPRKFSFDETVLRYQDLVGASDRLLFVHPDWWGGPPAIMKGFLDRVLRPGVAYGFREADFKDADAAGLLSKLRVDVFVTTDAARSGAPAGAAAPEATWPPARVWKESVLGFCGVKNAMVHVFWGLRDSSYAERKAWLDAVPELLA